MKKSRTRCTHRILEIRTESDKCVWIACRRCELVGPAKHSVTLALLAWIMVLSNQREKRNEKRRATRKAIRSGTQSTVHHPAH